VITDDEVMRLFERADPARVDHVAVRIDAAGYLDALRLEADEQLVPVTEIFVPITDSPTSETRNRRRLAMAAAAVVAVIGVAAIAINSMNSDDEVEPAPAVQPTVAPTTVAARTGTYVMSEFHTLGGNSDVRLTFAVPAGWEDGGFYVDKPLAAHVFFDYVTNIYTDSCPSVLVDPPVGPTVDDLASAWANLPGFHATAPTDITVDGYHGKQVEFTVPDYNKTDCPYGDFKLLASGNGVWSAPGPNQHNQLWILDVNGTRLVIVAFVVPDASPQDRADLYAVLASIQIG
jgi:hypothetical protein